MLAVKQRGGVVIVQDPKTAFFPSMPENALRVVRPDYCVSASEMAALLVKLVNQKTVMRKSKNGRKAAMSTKSRKQTKSRAEPFVCPECSGPLFPDVDGPRGRLKCLVGHSFAPQSLSEMHRDALERALLTTMRLLEERARVHQHLASTGTGNESGRARERFQECAESAKKDVALLRDILERI